jgi:hypothetical protein
LTVTARQRTDSSSQKGKPNSRTRTILVRLIKRDRELECRHGVAGLDAGSHPAEYENNARKSIVETLGENMRPVKDDLERLQSLGLVRTTGYGRGAIWFLENPQRAN